MIVDSFCVKICELFVTKKEVLYEFIENYIRDHTEERSLLYNLSNLYVMVASAATKDVLRTGELQWEDVMSSKEFAYLSENRFMIVGVIHISSTIYPDVDLIEWIDTRIRGLNIAKHMIRRYETSFTDKILLPREIIPSAANYWQKELDVNDVDDIITEYPLLKDEFIWDTLTQITT